MNRYESPTPTATTSFAFLPLPNLATNALARVSSVNVDTDDAVRLKSLGICVGRRVQMVKCGDPLVIRVLGARVGLSARLASAVVVEQL